MFVGGGGGEVGAVYKNMGPLIFHACSIHRIFKILSLTILDCMHTCDKFQKGIREIFLSFHGGLTKIYSIYRKILNSDGSFKILVKNSMFLKKF